MRIKITMLLLLCLFLSGCSGRTQEQKAQKEKIISEISIPGVTEFCMDEAGEYYYYTVSGESVIYQCTAEGTPVAQFMVDADDSQPEVLGYMGENPAETIDLSCLCIYEDTLYCYRYYKGTLLAVDISTGKSRLLTTFEEPYSILKMSAGANTVMLLSYGEAEKEAFVYHIDTQVLEPVPVEHLLGIAGAGGDTYWLNVKDEEEQIYFQEYQADTGVLSEAYASNFTEELTEMTYEKETGLLYGTLYSEQYLCFSPKEAQQVSRFQGQPVYESPTSFQAVGGRLYILDREQETVYHLAPNDFVVENKPLKGYVTSELVVSEWAGYTIDLELTGTNWH